MWQALTDSLKAMTMSHTHKVIVYMLLKEKRAAALWYAGQTWSFSPSTVTEEKHLGRGWKHQNIFLKHILMEMDFYHLYKNY